MNDIMNNISNEKIIEKLFKEELLVAKEVKEV